MTEPTERAEVLLAAEGIVQSYPGVQALKGVDLTLMAGEITALVGENGAGKSTLIRILAGIETPVAGTLTIRGTERRLASPKQSQDAGISVVSQEFRLVPQLTVAENLLLGNELTRAGLIPQRETNRRAKVILQELGLDLEPSRKVETLSLADQQLVEISRALGREFDVLILDEPTAALGKGEVNRLLALVERVRASGKAIVYVSHHLDEIFSISQKIVVFRDGSKVAELPTADATEQDVVGHMLGRAMTEIAREARAVPVVAPVETLALEGFRCPRVGEPISLRLHEGEIIGLAGLVGSGRSELMRAVYGALPSTGRLSLAGRPVSVTSAKKALQYGIYMLSESRKLDGIVPHLSVLENMFIGPTSRPRRGVGRFVPLRRRERAQFARARSELTIKTSSPDQLIGNLSGGNQQKVLLGRATASGCRILLLNEPTRGVDIGAKAEIYHLINTLAAEGYSIIVSSSDTPELVALSHRCLVLRDGHVTVDLRGDEITESAILAASIGTEENG